MSLDRLCAIYSFAAIAATVQSALPPSLRYQIPVVVNKITDLVVSCDSGNINATVTFQYPFKGVLFAKDFCQECKATGSLSNSISINLPTSGCGVRLSTKDDGKGKKQMLYGVVLVAQQDRHLRQIADQEKHVECPIDENAFTIKSRFMAEAVKSDLMEKKNYRVARMRKTADEEDVDEELDDQLMAARAWMEIIPEEQRGKLNEPLQVGDQVSLSIKSTLPDGIGWKIVDCVAHDGSGDSSQKLLNEDGCPIDELLMPIPQFGPAQPISLMRHQEAVSKFAAFKFPDKDSLHLSCSLELCKGPCLMIDCFNGTADNRLGRTLPVGAEDGQVLDHLKVYNSIEVIAPAIDDLRKSDRLQLSEPSTYPFRNLPGDRTFCVSPDKIAVTFCLLGVIFLCAVVVAACALFRARRNGSDGPFYTRSLFSSSSGGSAYGSKLLLHDSPCMGQPPSRGMHYGRIL